MLLNTSINKSLSFTNLNDLDEEKKKIPPVVVAAAASSSVTTANGDLHTPAIRPVKHRDRNNNSFRVSSTGGRGGGGSDPPPIPPRQSQQAKQLTPPPATSGAVKPPPPLSKVNYLGGSLADDCYVFEETGDDCVYQITFKKVFNKNLATVNSSSGGQADHVMSASSSSTMPASTSNMTKNYSDYRLSSQATANAFKLLMPVSNSSSNLMSNNSPTGTANSEDNNNNNNSSNSSSSTGLVYTRIKVKQLKYATLKKFIEHLTSEETGEMDSSLVQTFLATYRTFSDTRTVLDALIARYLDIVPASLDMTEDVRVESLRSFRCIVKMWLDSYGEDFNEPSEFANLATLKQFVLEHMTESPELPQILDDKLKQFKIDNISLVNAATAMGAGGGGGGGGGGGKLTGHFLKNNKSFNHQRQHSHHHLQHHAPPSTTTTPTPPPLPATGGGTMPASGGQHHRRSYSNFTELSHTNKNGLIPTPLPPPSAHHSATATATTASNLKHKEKSSSNSFLNALFGSEKPVGGSSSSSSSKANATTALDQLRNNRRSSHYPNYQLNLNDSFMSLDNTYIAEQLTYIDKCLFERVNAHHCLGSVWGTRHQKQHARQPSTVKINDSLSSSTATNSSASPPAVTVNQQIDKFASIRAFIDQFNCVSFVVQATILERIDLRPTERARIVKKWIEIAQECRKYKNFSALNAIVQGLNTQCVSRLEKTWAEVPAEARAQFNELTEMFSQDQNQRIFRDILMKDLAEYKAMLLSKDDAGISETGIDIYVNDYNSDEYNNEEDDDELLFNNYDDDDENDEKDLHFDFEEGTAKYADINSGINATLSRKMKEKMFKQQKKNRQFREPVGTIPFLGTFLKDLEYIHAQNPTKNDKGQINVMQKRKEFEIIAQIRLLQQAAQLYRIREDPNFKQWLFCQPVFREEHYYDLSYLIEPKFDRDSSHLSANNGTSSSNRKTKSSVSQGSRSESVESVYSYNQNVNNNNNNNNNFNMMSSITSRTSSSTSKNIVPTREDRSRNSSIDNSDIVDPTAALGSSFNPTKSGMTTTDSPPPLPFSKRTSLPPPSPRDTIASGGSSSNSNLEPFSTLQKYTKSSTSSIHASSNNSPSEIRVKVNIESVGGASGGGSGDALSGSSILYKKMSINDKYRTKDVKRLILEKFFMNADLSDKYQLVQILDPQNYTSSFSAESSATFQPSHDPVKELVINDNCNVYYAAKNIADMLFVLRRKEGSGASPAMPGFTSSNSNLGGPSSLQQQGSGGSASGSPNLPPRTNRTRSMYPTSGNNIFDQLPPQAPSSGKSKSGSVSGPATSSGGEGGGSGKNWKFLKKILS